MRLLGHASPGNRQDAQDGIIGKSVILHEKADDLKSQPSGDSGSRSACAVIKFQTQKTRAPHL